MGERMLYLGIRKNKKVMNEEFITKRERKDLKRRAAQSTQNIIDGKSGFGDVITLVQNQVIDEFPYLTISEEGMSDTIIYMATFN